MALDYIFSELETSEVAVSSLDVILSEQGTLFDLYQAEYKFASELKAAFQVLLLDIENNSYSIQDIIAAINVNQPASATDIGYCTVIWKDGNAGLTEQFRLVGFNIVTSVGLVNIITIKQL